MEKNYLLQRAVDYPAVGEKHTSSRSSRFVGALIAVLIALPALVFAAGEGEMFIDNGKIRLGVDLASGGSVFYLSESVPRRNLLNGFDRGRFIQQSYYGDSDESRWNPVQGGDYKGLAAGLIEHTSTSESHDRPDR
jgi:hypothetical protein